MTRIVRVLILGALAAVGIAACKMPGMNIDNGEPSTPTLTINTVAGDDVVDETEDGSTVTIDGTITNVATGTKVTVTLDDADADSDPDITKNSTVDAVGSWSVSVTSQEVRGLEAGMVVVTAVAGDITVARTITYTPLKTEVCANGAPDAADPSHCRRGQYPLNGIDTIPLDHVKVTNKEMQRMFFTMDATTQHATGVAIIMCDSYITQSRDCEDSANRTGKTRHQDGTTTTTTGTAPFTELIYIPDGSNSGEISNDWRMSEMRRGGMAKIVNVPMHPVNVDLRLRGGTDLHLTLNGAGNDGFPSLFDEPRVTKYITPTNKAVILRAIREHKLLFIAGWDRDGDGRYVRDPNSNGCKGVDAGCLWAPFLFPSTEIRGTSHSVSRVSAALAAILSVFPDTSGQNLAKLAVACARKSGDGIEELLRKSGGAGVADFSCMGVITDALQGLSPGATVSVTVNGKTVRVSERELVVP